jgi:hypothetical protein
MADQGPPLTWLQRLSRNTVGQRFSSRIADRPLTLTHIGSPEELAAEIADAKRRLAVSQQIEQLEAPEPTPALLPKPETPETPETPAATAAARESRVAATPPPIPIAPVTPVTPVTPVAPAAQAKPVTVPPVAASAPVKAVAPAVRVIPIMEDSAAPVQGASEPKRLSFIEAEERALQSRVNELKAAEERAVQRRLEIERRLAALTPEPTSHVAPTPTAGTPSDAASSPGSPITIKIGRLDAVQETNAGK